MVERATFPDTDSERSKSFQSATFELLKPPIVSPLSRPKQDMTLFEYLTITYLGFAVRVNSVADTRSCAPLLPSGTVNIPASSLPLGIVARILVRLRKTKALPV